MECPHYTILTLFSKAPTLVFTLPMPRLPSKLPNAMPRQRLAPQAKVMATPLRGNGDRIKWSSFCNLSEDGLSLVCAKCQNTCT